jgi:hypothetical protein
VETDCLSAARRLVKRPDGTHPVCKAHLPALFSGKGCSQEHSRLLLRAQRFFFSICFPGLAEILKLSTSNSELQKT